MARKIFSVAFFFITIHNFVTDTVLSRILLTPLG